MARLATLHGVGLLLLLFAWGCESTSTSVIPSNRNFSELSDSSFAIGASGVLEVENFAGSVDVQTGSAGTVRVVAEKWAENEADLDGIRITMVELSNGIGVTASNPDELLGVSVDLDITVPPDTRPTIENGAGGVGYRGPALGDSRFSTAVGSIELSLPDDVNVEVHLSVGVGGIDLDFPVDGQVGQNAVDGIIGTGADGRIDATVGVGRIAVVAQ